LKLKWRKMAFGWDGGLKKEKRKKNKVQDESKKDSPKDALKPFNKSDPTVSRENLLYSFTMVCQK